MSKKPDAKPDLRTVVEATANVANAAADVSSRAEIQVQFLGTIVQYLLVAMRQHDVLPEEGFADMFNNVAVMIDNIKPERLPHPGDKKGLETMLHELAAAIGAKIQRRPAN